MDIRRIIQRRIRASASGVDFAGDVNAAVAANVGGRGSSATHVSSTQNVQTTQSNPPRRKED